MHSHLCSTLSTQHRRCLLRLAAMAAHSNLWSEGFVTVEERFPSLGGAILYDTVINNYTEKECMMQKFFAQMTALGG